jgi:nitronate monooxygenase
MELTSIIQGGAGIGVAGWLLARAVAMRGETGVISGTALDLLLARRLQLGDPGGHLRRALRKFPNQLVAERILKRYFIEGGKKQGRRFADKPIIGQRPTRQVTELLVAANFCEVYLAKRKASGPIGINYMHNVRTPLLASLYGAMLAEVDLVTISGDIALEMPAVLDRLSRHQPAEIKLALQDPAAHPHLCAFDPSLLFGFRPPTPRPRLMPIVSSASQAKLLQQSAGSIDGFIVHLTPDGEEIDLAAIRALKLPFYLSGGYGTRAGLARARKDGAAGIQVSTLFAFCEESGLRPDLKQSVIAKCLNGWPRVFTDQEASPTGDLLKILELSGTLGNAVERAPRACDLGYFREAYELPDGKLAWRCSAELPDAYTRKGGSSETNGRKCICNALSASVGLGQKRRSGEEPPLITCDSSPELITHLLQPGANAYDCAAVIDFLSEE